MKRQGTDDGWLEIGDILLNTDEGTLYRVGYVRRDSASLKEHIDPSNDADSSTWDVEPIVEDILDGDGVWELVAEPSDDVRLNRSLFYSFIDAVPPEGDTVETETIAQSDFRSAIVHGWCTYDGTLSTKGKNIISYYRNLSGSDFVVSPEERVDDIGVSGFVKRANRYDKPMVLDAILAILDRNFPDAEITAYRSDSAYVSVDGDAERAAELLRHLHSHGLAADFREDDRYDVDVNPTKLTVDTTVEPRTGDRAGASQSVTTNIHRV